MVPRLGLNASLAGGLPAAGSVALVSQTGAVGAALVDWAGAQRVGFSYVVALGETFDVDSVT
jgi:acetyltransferase